MCKNHVFGSKNIFLRPNGIFLFLQNEQKKKKNLLSQHLALNYWPLSVAATKGPLVLETRDVERPQKSWGIWLQLLLLLCIGTETHKTRVGRIIVMGMRQRVDGQQIDQSVCNNSITYQPCDLWQHS